MGPRSDATGCNTALQRKNGASDLHLQRLKPQELTSNTTGPKGVGCCIGYRRSANPACLLSLTAVKEKSYVKNAMSSARSNQWRQRVRARAWVHGDERILRTAKR